MKSKDLPIIPIQDKILVRKFEREEKKTESGIIISAQVQEELEKYNLCEVLALGDGEVYGNENILGYVTNYAGHIKVTKKIDFKVEVGDIVVTERVGNNKTIMKDGEKYILIGYNEIWGIYEKGKK